MGAMAIVLLLLAKPRTSTAQTPNPVPLDVIEIWITHHVTPERAWRLAIQKDGIAFRMDERVEHELTAIGATDAWLQMLRNARVVTSSAEQARGASAPRRPRVHLSKRDLFPIYYGNQGRIAFYTDISRLQETGGSVNRTITTSSGDTIQLQNAGLRSPSFMYGLLVDVAGGQLDLQGYFHQHGLLFVNMGFAIGPFLPLGTSGFRPIVGITPLIGLARQTLGHTKKSAGDTTSNSVVMFNMIYGADARAGLAYHWRPGVWGFAEAHYRLVGTLKRSFEVPGEPTVTNGIPWPSWSARGAFLRVGIGF
jgi:hypothetical protein